MADTRQNISIPRNVWTDIYSLTGVTVGAAISVENIGDSDIYLSVQATQPDVQSDSFVIIERGDIPFRNSKGDSGAWAFAPTSAGKLNVRTIS
jgi:hypothetical protein